MDVHGAVELHRPLPTRFHHCLQRLEPGVSSLQYAALYYDYVLTTIAYDDDVGVVY